MGNYNTGKHTRGNRVGAGGGESFGSPAGKRRATRADDRRVAGNTEGRKAAFDSGFFAQTEARLASGVDQAAPAWGQGRVGSSVLNTRANAKDKQGL